MPNFKVSISCLCYNHTPFIHRTLDGIAMQLTNFEYIAVIIDDASSDGTQKAIGNYAKNHFITLKDDWETNEARYFYLRHKDNTNFYLVVILLKYNFYQLGKSKLPLISEWADNAEYYAFCECDDFWIDEHKLQEQVEFMDKNPAYGLIYTDYNTLNYDTGEQMQALFHNGINPIITSFEDHLVKSAYIAPMSWLSRFPYSELLNNYKGPLTIDKSFIIALEIFKRSKVYYLDKVTCVYGKHAGSATKQSSMAKQYEYSHGVYATQKYYLDKYNLREKYLTCLDKFLNAFYCFIIAEDKKEDYFEVQSFFHRKAKSSIKFRLMEIMMKSECTFPILQSICRLRIKKK